MPVSVSVSVVIKTPTPTPTPTLEMQKAILLIEDDKEMQASIAKGLRAGGFAVVLADSADMATEIISKIIFDCIVLDRMMPGTDGLTALSNWRAAGLGTPVIMLTAMDGADNTIAGLEAGADDYLSKPFALKELVLRINNLISKSAISNQQSAITMPVGLEFRDDEFFVNSELLLLSDSEKELLQSLTAPVGNVAPSVPMVAKRLREKLLARDIGVDIITVRGKGYKLVVSL